MGRWYVSLNDKEADIYTPENDLWATVKRIHHFSYEEWREFMTNMIDHLNTDEDRIIKSRQM